MHTTHPLLIASAVALSCGAVLLPGGARATTPRTVAAPGAVSGHGEPAVPHPTQQRAPQLVSQERATVPAVRPAAPRAAALHPVANHLPATHPATQPASRSRAAHPAAHLTATHLAAPAPVRLATQHRTAARRPIVVRVQHVVARPPARRPVVRKSPPPPPPAPVPRPSSGHDDYPYASTSGYVSDRWGFTERQCTSFVAWRLAQVGRPLNNATQGWGDASHWDDTARALGRAVSASPAVGTVAQWGAGESSPLYAAGSSTANGTFTAGRDGHLAWVRSVFSDGSVLVEQYNLYGNESYSMMRIKAPRYLHLQ